MAQSPDADERTVAVDNAAGNAAYKVMAWFLVADLAIRAKWPAWTTWHGFPVDVLAVLCAGCLTWSWVAWRNRIVSRRYLLTLVAALTGGGLVALALILLSHLP